MLRIVSECILLADIHLLTRECSEACLEVRRLAVRDTPEQVNTAKLFSRLAIKEVFLGLPSISNVPAPQQPRLVIAC